MCAQVTFSSAAHLGFDVSCTLTSPHTLRDYTSDPEFQLGSVDGDDAPASVTPQSGRNLLRRLT